MLCLSLCRSIGLRVILFAVLVLGPAARGAGVAPCAAVRLDERAVVRYVIDGDTVILTDGRKVRLVGIDAPELGHELRSAEPYANAARSALSGLLGAHRIVGLQHEVQRRDGYHRHLAHLFLPDGTNVQAWLLRQGLGIHLVIPPNLQYLDCYRHAETEAAQARRGIWMLERYQTVEAGTIGQVSNGYRIVSGTVTGVERKGSLLWIYLGSGDLRLRVLQEPLPGFGPVGLTRLRGSKVVARGWVYRRRGRTSMTIRHPVDLKLIPPR